MKMNMSLLRKIAVAAVTVAALLPAFSAPSLAQSYPNRPITMVYPYAAGGVGDYVGRLFAQHLSAKLGQNVVVENLAGASGTVGYGSLLTQPANGYRIALGVNDLPLNDTLQPDRAFKSDAFEGITTLAAGSFLLVANPNFPGKTLAEMLDYAKANPGKVSIGTTATTQTIMLTEIGRKLGITFNEVRFVNVGQQITAVLNGEINLAWTTLLTAKPHFDSKALVPVAVSTKDRIPQLPDTPSLSEKIPGFDFAFWFGFVAKKGTPANVVDRLNKATAEVLAMPEVRQAVSERGMSVIDGEGPAKLTARIANDSKVYAEIFKAAPAEKK